MPLLLDPFYAENAQQYEPVTIDRALLSERGLTFYPVAGVETEYFSSGVERVSQPGNQDISVQMGNSGVNESIFKALTRDKPLTVPDTFIEANGARFYIDGPIEGQHLEYSTPEARDLDDVVYAVAAGHRTINLGGENAEVQFREEGKDVRLKVFAYNWHGNKWEKMIGSGFTVEATSVGTHENYLVSRYVPIDKLILLMVPFLDTRIIYSGSGLVKPEKNGRYEISSRVPFINRGASRGTIEWRGIYNTKDRPYADRERFRRSHLIVGESVMSDFQRKLTIGTTRLVYALIELIHQRGINPLEEVSTLRDPVETLQKISRDLTLKERVCKFKKGKHTAVWTNRQYFEAVTSADFRETIREMVGPYDFDWTVFHWDRVLTALEQDPMELSTELDYLIKLANFEELIARSNEREKNKTTWDAMVPKLQQSYHRAHPRNQLFEGLVQQGKVIVLHEDREERIQRAMENPPIGTRAEGRVRKLREIITQNGIYGVNWAYVQQYTPEMRLFLNNDPRVSEFDSSRRSHWQTNSSDL